jgi:hypothetical protein
MPKTITTTCEGCGITFTVASKGKNRHPKYCSKTCFREFGMSSMRKKAHESLKGKYAAVIGHKKPRTEFCRNCGTLIDKKPSTKSRFCNQACFNSYNRASSIPKSDGTIVTTQKRTLKWQRKHARKLYGNKCCRCGYCEVPEILQVHHVDYDPTHQDDDNLLLLCPNCHEAEHFKTKTGRFGSHVRYKKKPHHETYKFRKSASLERVIAVDAGESDPGPRITAAPD